MLLKDESSTIKRFGKNAQIEYKNMTFSMNQFGQNFLFFSFSIFFAIFLDRFEEKAHGHQKK